MSLGFGLFASETFWTAVGSIGTVTGALGAFAALYLIYRQIRTTKEIAAYEFLRREDDRFELDDMRRHRRDLARVLISRPKEVDGIEDHADYILGYFEDLGLLLRKGLAPDYYIWTMKSYWILRYWPVLKHYVDSTREDTKDQTYYSDFELLYNRMLKCEKKERHIKTISFPVEEMKEFLAGELDLKLRAFKRSDLDTVLEIEEVSFGEDAYPKSRFERLYRSHPDGFIVADVLEEVVGYAIGYVSGGVGEIDSVAVDPRYRGLAIGQELLEWLIDGFRAAGVEICSLEVRTTNESAIGLYRKMGFEVVGTLKAYYSDKGSAYLMKSNIRPSAVRVEKSFPVRVDDGA